MAVASLEGRYRIASSSGMECLKYWLRHQQEQMMRSVLFFLIFFHWKSDIHGLFISYNTHRIARNPWEWREVPHIQFLPIQLTHYISKSDSYQYFPHHYWPDSFIKNNYNAHNGFYSLSKSHSVERDGLTWWLNMIIVIAIMPEVKAIIGIPFSSWLPTYTVKALWRNTLGQFHNHRAL